MHALIDHGQLRLLVCAIPEPQHQPRGFPGHVGSAKIAARVRFECAGCAFSSTKQWLVSDQVRMVQV